jgi:hypothetical protein
MDDSRVRLAVVNGKSSDHEDTLAMRAQFNF